MPISVESNCKHCCFLFIKKWKRSSWSTRSKKIM